jgi:hypothetical protein
MGPREDARHGAVPVSITTPRFCRSSGARWSNKSIEESAKTYHNSCYALPTILSKSIVPSRYLLCWLKSTVDSA